MEHEAVLLYRSRIVSKIQKLLKAAHMSDELALKTAIELVEECSVPIMFTISGKKN